MPRSVGRSFYNHMSRPCFAYILPSPEQKVKMFKSYQINIQSNGLIMNVSSVTQPEWILNSLGRGGALSRCEGIDYQGEQGGQGVSCQVQAQPQIMNISTIKHHKNVCFYQIHNPLPPFRLTRLCCIFGRLGKRHS